MSLNEIKSIETLQELEIREKNTVWVKTICGIDSRVFGAPHILTRNHIEQLEAVREKKCTVSNICCF